MNPPERIRFQCPHCTKPLNVPAQHAGKRGQCPSRKCGQPLVIPASPEPAGERPDRETDRHPDAPTRRTRNPDARRLARSRTLIALAAVLLAMAGVGTAAVVAARMAAGGTAAGPSSPDAAGEPAPPPVGAAGPATPATMANAAVPTRPHPAPPTDRMPEPKPAPPPAEKIPPPARTPVLTGLRPVIADGWTRHVSEHGGFAVDFPNDAKEKPQEFSPGMVQAAIQVDFFPPVTLSYSAYGSKSDKRALAKTAKARLDTVQDEIVKGFKNGAIESEKAITLGGRPGREIEVVTHKFEAGVVVVNGKHVTRARIHLVDDGYFVVEVVGDARSVAHPNTTLFLDSFQLVPFADAPPVARPPAEQPDGWKAVTHTKSKLTFEVPPGSTTEDGDDRVTVTLKGGDDSHIVSWADVDQEELKGKTVEQYLDGRRDRLLAILRPPVRCDLRAEKMVKLGPHPGREIEITKTGIDAGGIVITDVVNIFRGRVFVVGGRVYMIYTLGKPEFTASKETTRFLDSFKLAD